MKFCKKHNVECQRYIDMRNNIVMACPICTTTKNKAREQKTKLNVLFNEYKNKKDELFYIKKQIQELRLRK